MPAKVLIERFVRGGYEGIVWDMLRQIRSEAVRTRGYIYGETWRSSENPRIFMVLSVWASLEYWRSWSQDTFRLKVEDRMAPMLRKPSVVAFLKMPLILSLRE